MKAMTLKLYTLDYKDPKAYIASLVFVIGNIALPQLFHLIPYGGITFLPIYFFTLIAAYKYGWKVGIITAIFSPLLNNFFFGMPPLAVLPIIMFKSVLLAVASGIAASYFKRISIPVLLGVVFAYQLIGTLGEWIITGNFFTVTQDFRIGIPGMLLQVLGGYVVIKYLINK